MDAHGAFIEEESARLYEEWQRTDMRIGLNTYIDQAWRKHNEIKD